MLVEIEGIEGIQYIGPVFITEEERNNTIITDKEVIKSPTQ